MNSEWIELIEHMTLYLIRGSAVFGYSLPVKKLPALLERFLEKYPDTIEVEAHGQEILARDFDEAMIPPFVRSVCNWGDYAGIAGRVLNNNSPANIRAAFREAAGFLTSSPPDPGRALAAVNRIRGLGTPSFASKHLRFVRPDVCPVLDSVLRDVLPYPFNPTGYSSFSIACLQLAQSVTSQGIPSPHPARRKHWLAADVEAALFCHVQGWLS